MTLVAVLLLLVSGTLAVLAIALLYQATHRERAQRAALADQRGWNHRPKGTPETKPLARRVLGDPTDPSLRLLDQFEGPSRVGPFSLTRIQSHTPQGTRTHEHTLLHIRTPIASPGLHIRPAGEFRPTGADPITPHDADRFSRLYEVTSLDEDFLENALDPDTRAFIAAPKRTIRLDWIDQDLLIAIPLSARTPRAVESLVAWSAALAARLTETRTPYQGRGAHRLEPTPSQQSLRMPSGVDLMMP